MKTIIILLIFFFATVVSADADSYCIDKKGNRATIVYTANGLIFSYKAGIYDFINIKKTIDATPGSEYIYAEYKSHTHKIVEEYFDLTGSVTLISPNGYKVIYSCHLFWPPKDY